MATRHYTTKDFFRQIPNALLARYFHERELFPDLDFSAMKETKPDALFAAWLELKEKVRNPMDAVFREIFDMSCKKGFNAIIDEALWQFQDQGAPEKLEPFVDALSELPNHYHRAMVTFLDHHDCWKGATRFYHVDMLTSYWRKRKHLGHIAAAVDDASIQQLSDLIGGYFHHTFETGPNCFVEPFRRQRLTPKSRFCNGLSVKGGSRRVREIFRWNGENARPKAPRKGSGVETVLPESGECAFWQMARSPLIPGAFRQPKNQSCDYNFFPL